MNRWKWLAGRLAKRIWFRASIISILSILLALAARGLAPLIPYDLSLKIGAKAVDNILTILASSMLAVATFSIAAMVAAFNGAAQNVTPRAAQLLIEDKTAQNALSTFIGAFLFGIVGIVALSTGFYGAEGRAILFIGTVLMIGWIAITLLRWIGQLTQFGRMADTVCRVESATVEAVCRHRGPILLAGRAALDSQPGWFPVHGEKTGYVTHVDDAKLDSNEMGDQSWIRIASPAGRFVDPRVPLAWTSSPTDKATAERIRQIFTIEDQRQFAHDPRFGTIVLSEIASRALSPAVNDPGSAIAVLGAAQRVAETVIREFGGRPNEEGAVACPLSLEEIVEDLVVPIARDGAGLAEVGIRLQTMLGSLAEAAPSARHWLRALADDALQRAGSEGLAPRDWERLKRAHGRAF